jgi:hypothetical protein
MRSLTNTLHPFELTLRQAQDRPASRIEAPLKRKHATQPMRSEPSLVFRSPFGRAEQRRALRERATARINI